MGAPPDDGSGWYWQIVKIGGVFALIGGTLTRLIEGFWQRKVSESQEMRRNLVDRVRDLEVRFDTERRECDRKIDELRAESDRNSALCHEKLEALRSSNDALRTESARETEEYNEKIDGLRTSNNELLQRIYILEFELSKQQLREKNNP